MTRIKGQKPLTGEEKQQIVQRYADGETLESLMAAFKRGKPTVRHVLTDAGVEIRRRGYATGREWDAAWREAHKRGTSTDEFREASRKSLLKRLPSMRGPAVNSPIEQRLHDALKAVGIGFTTQKLLLGRHLVDIMILQQPVVIEADGAQHQLREQRLKDVERDKALTTSGFRIFRFTGSEINKDSAACIQRVIDECGLVSDENPVYDIKTQFSGENHPLWKGGPKEFTCEKCGISFHAQPSHRKGPHVYCTRKCANSSRRGTRS